MNVNILTEQDDQAFSNSTATANSKRLPDDLTVSQPSTSTGVSINTPITTVNPINTVNPNTNNTGNVVKSGTPKAAHGTGAGSSERYTLFLKGLPQELTTEQLTALVSNLDGFAGCRIRKPRRESNGNNGAPSSNANNKDSDQLLGFVEFSSARDALKATETLNNSQQRVPNGGIFTIHAEAAKPSRPMRTAFTSGYAARFTLPMFPQPVMDPRLLHVHPNVVQPPMAFPSPAWPPATAGPIAPVPQAIHRPLPGPGIGSGQSTLYVSGLPSDTTEREVGHVFRPFPGYVSVQLYRRKSKLEPSEEYVSAFVTFDNQNAAEFCRASLQGYVFDPEASPQKQLKVSFAKSDTYSSQRDGQ